MTSEGGRSFEFRVNSIVGDVLTTGFPVEGTSVDVTWLWADGESRCILGYRRSRFVGTFTTSEPMTVDVSDESSSTVWSGPSGSGYSTEVFGEGTYAGFVQFADRRVQYNVGLVYSTCAGSCGSTPASDYVYSHTTTVTLDGKLWNLEGIRTGWKKQSPSSLPSYYWQGSISGPVAGRLEKRPIANAADALDVVIGSDRYTTRGVARP